MKDMSLEPSADRELDMGKVAKEIGGSLKCGEITVGDDGRELEQQLEFSLIFFFKVYLEGVLGTAAPSDNSRYSAWYAKRGALSAKKI